LVRGWLSEEYIALAWQESVTLSVDEITAAQLRNANLSYRDTVAGMHIHRNKNIERKGTLDVFKVLGKR
jgi:hypothetical protein